MLNKKISRYLNYFYGIQLLVGAAVCFYYTIYWAVFLLLIASAVILVPAIFASLKKRLKGGLEAGCVIFILLFALFAFVSAEWIWSLISPPDINKGIALLWFEDDFNKATKPCFDAYESTMTKTFQDREQQCNAISSAENACKKAQQDVDSLSISDKLDKNIVSLLNEIRADVKTSLQGWENAYTEYNKQCSSQTPIDNASSVKMYIVTAVKSKYVVDIKLKQARSLAGVK